MLYYDFNDDVICLFVCDGNYIGLRNLNFAEKEYANFINNQEEWVKNFACHELLRPGRC